jgi:hypothetical protein
MRTPTSILADLIEHGFAHVPGFLNKNELAAITRDIHQYVPTLKELQATPQRYIDLLEDTEAGKFEFPFVGHALNHATTHPRLITLVEKLLGSPDVLLSRSCVWAKYGGGTEYEQNLHLDYEGNTLVVPRDEDIHRQVNMILYYSDVSKDSGPTFVVPRKKAAAINAGVWPPHRFARDWHALYEIEQPVYAKAGDLFIFGMGTFHRGSGITNPNKARYTHHFVYHAAAHRHLGHHCWPGRGEEAAMSEFLQNATPRQREVIGFPKPGDPYWTPETLAGVAQRYPRMDLRPYRAAMK